MNELIETSVRDYRRNWRRLFVTGIYYQIIAFILLTPLVSILFHVFMAVSGKSLLADQDILLFFFSPLGWLALITTGALWLCIAVLQLAAMLAILADTTPDGMRSLGALRFAISKAWPTLQLTARVAIYVSLSVAPFLAVIAVVYFGLLGEFDINFYLAKKPPVFFVALGIGVVIVAAMVAVLLGLFTGWALALPMVLFGNVAPAKVLGLSRERASGHRRKILFWILSWLMATFVISAVATSAVIWAARTLVAVGGNSLQFLTIAIGTGLVVWFVVNLAVSLLSTTTLATLIFNLYRYLGRSGNAAPLNLDLVQATSDNPGFLLTRRRLLAGCAVGFVIALVTGVSVLRSASLMDQVDVIAHRGASKAAPENTMASVRQAIADGADWVEIDVQETADGNVVVFHDSDFMKLAGVNLKIWNATMNDLENIDIGSWFAPEFNNERVPTLSEVLDACKGKVGLYIELKYYGHDVQLEQKVVDLVETHGMADDVVVISLKVDAIRKMKSLRPGWKAGLLMSVSAGNLAKIDADFLAVNASFASKRFIRSANRLGKVVCVWTVNDPVGMSTMISRGVTGIITDDPALARSVLEQRARMSVSERLLLDLAGLLGVESEISEQ